MNTTTKDGTLVPFPRQAKKEWVFTDSRTFWERPDLNITEKGLCTLIRCCANREGQAWPTMEQLAGWSGLHIETVSRHLRSLTKKKEITSEPYRDDFGHRRYLYTVKMFKNPWGKITPMAHGGKNPPLTVTIVNKKLFIEPAWCKSKNADPGGCSEQAIRQIEARHGPAI